MASNLKNSLPMYDVVVIGSGLGGLSSALALAKAGKSVLLLEQHNLPGGCSTSFVRGRFEFDAALHEFCALGEDGHLGYAGKLLKEEYGIDIDTCCAPELFRAVLTSRSGRYYDVTLPFGEEAFIEALEKAVPGNKDAVEAYLSLSKECYEVSQYFDAHMFLKKKRNGDVKISALHFMKHYFRYLQVAEEPYNEVCRKLGMSEDVIDILNCYRVYLGVDGNTVSFAHLATMIYSYIAYKPGYIIPNSHALSLSLQEKFESYGGKTFFGVKAIHVEADKKGNITGVSTDHGFFPCKGVIANMYPLSAYNGLLSPNIKVPMRERKRYKATPPSSRFVNIYIGLNKSSEELGIDEYTLFYPGDLRYPRLTKGPLDYLQAAATHYNRIYPEASPKGTSIMTLTLEFEDDIWASVPVQDYFKTKEAIAKKAIAEYEEVSGRKITPYIEEIEIASPWTFARYLKTPEGAVYGVKFGKHNSILSALQSIRRDNPIKGFKTTGASGARGDGFSQSIASGYDMAKLLLEELGKEKAHG